MSSDIIKFRNLLIFNQKFKIRKKEKSSVTFPIIQWLLELILIH